MLSVCLYWSCESAKKELYFYSGEAPELGPAALCIVNALPARLTALRWVLLLCVQGFWAICCRKLVMLGAAFHSR